MRIKSGCKRPGPIALLQVKIANLAEINQRGRQDGRHIGLLARIMPGYLEDLRVLVEKGGLDERQLIEFLKRLLALVTSPRGRKAWAVLRLNPRALFAELKPTGLSKFRAFLKKRLPRVIPHAAS